MARMNWDGARAQARVGPRTGNGGGLQYIRRPVSRITATGSKRAAAGRTLEYGVSAEWPDDIAPRVQAFFRWGGGPWCPTRAAESAVEECLDEPDLPIEELDRLSDDEWAQHRVWRPRPVEHRGDILGYTWWIEQQGDDFWLGVDAVDEKRKRSVVPLEVARVVADDHATWADLVKYTTAILQAQGTSFPVSKVGTFLRENGGKPRWKTPDPEPSVEDRSDRPPPAIPSTRNADDTQGQQGPSTGSPRGKPWPEPKTDQLTTPPTVARTKSAEASSERTGSPHDGERLRDELPDAHRLSLISAQLSNLLMLAAVRETGLLTASEVEAFKQSILCREGPPHPPRTGPPTPAPVPGDSSQYRRCPSCGHEKNRRGSNRCVACRREFAPPDASA